jgi:hypothetical protein
MKNNLKRLSHLFTNIMLLISCVMLLYSSFTRESLSLDLIGGLIFFGLLVVHERLSDIYNVLVEIRDGDYDEEEQDS